MYRIQKKGKFGFINSKGIEVIKPKFEQAFDFSEGLAMAVIEKEDKWMAGFVNEDGDWEIEPVFSGYGFSDMENSLFINGMAPVRASNSKMLYIDKVGKPITQNFFDKAYNFSENRALVANNGKYGYIDSLGNMVIDCMFDIGSFADNSRFSHGLAAVRFNKDDEGFESSNNFGYIDVDGEVYFEPEDHFANAFSEGFAMVGNAYEYYFINREGEIPFDRTTLVATSFSEELAAFYDTETECFGYIGTNGEWVIEPQFKEALRFTDGLACIKGVGSKNYGFIDKTGKVIIPDNLNIALPFKNGLAYVQQNNKRKYIDKTGNFVWSE